MKQHPTYSLLVEFIQRHQHMTKEIADSIGITVEVLLKKINGVQDFSLTETILLSKIFGIKPTYLFFTTESECMTT